MLLLCLYFPQTLLGSFPTLISSKNDSLFYMLLANYFLNPLFIMLIFNQSKFTILPVFRGGILLSFLEDAFNLFFLLLFVLTCLATLQLSFHFALVLVGKCCAFALIQSVLRTFTLLLKIFLFCFPVHIPLLCIFSFLDNSP